MTGAPGTVRVNVSEELPARFVAVSVITYVPPVPAAGVPESVPVPPPLSTNVTPLGSAPVDVIAGAGLPDVVTVKVPGAPTVNVVAFALVNVGPVSVPEPEPEGVVSKMRSIQ